MSLVRIHFNGEERVLAAGLRVRSLLTHTQVEQVQRGDLVVLDGKGRERGLDGAVLDGQTMQLAPRPRA
jgi:regulator of RNase E activity RraA